MDVKTERLEKRKKLLESRAEAVEKLNFDLRERLLFLLHVNITRARKYEYLEKRYGISARKWKNVCNRVQMPGIDMLSSILRDRPEYATWLMTGKASECKQFDPTLEHELDQTIEGRIDPTVKGWEEKYERIIEAQCLLINAKYANKIE